MAYARCCKMQSLSCEPTLFILLYTGVRPNAIGYKVTC